MSAKIQRAHLHFGFNNHGWFQSPLTHMVGGEGENDVWGDSKWMWTGDLVADIRRSTDAAFL